MGGRAPAKKRERDRSEKPLIDQLAFFENKEPQSQDFLSDVLKGFAKTPKTIPSKYFYDAKGARLFEEICLTDEYYLTRVELALLKSCAKEASSYAGARATIVEFGSGAFVKIRTLLDAFDNPFGLVAIDISRKQLLEATASLSSDFPHLKVGAICADFMKPVPMPPLVAEEGRVVGFLPGSTIGNFTPQTSARFLKAIRQTIGDKGALLIGVDLKKDKAHLEAAYNDRAGRTAAFNQNILARMRRELDAKIAQDGFAHHAFYNEKEGRVEMHLRAKSPQTITVNGSVFSFQKGENIHTENSYKYDIEEFLSLAQSAGFHAESIWTDAQHLFSLYWLEAEAL